jgi:predicted RNA binding protein YcfA (HicA-like mRNA interferase family)
MNSADFIRKVRKLGRKHGVRVRMDKGHGKGSHAVLTYGDRRTIVPNGELKKGTFRALCQQLGIDPEAL